MPISHLKILLSYYLLHLLHVHGDSEPLPTLENVNKNTDHQTFFNQWFNSDNDTPFELNDKQAAWWYSLGRYKPGYGNDVVYFAWSESQNLEDNESEECELIPAPIRTRWEIRQLNEVQRGYFYDAVLALANFCPDDCTPCNSVQCTSAFDLFTLMHLNSTSPGAHFGASFLPWHREFLFRFETALVTEGGYPAEQGLPYWDTVLDSWIPYPAQSVVWAPEYMGEPSGRLEEPFSGLSVIPECGGFVTRNGGGPICLLYTEEDIEITLNQTCFADLEKKVLYDCCGVQCKFFNGHGGAHIWVGGDMGRLQCAPAEPMFWLHHGFIDYIFEDFRQNAQETDLEREYPLTDYGIEPFTAWYYDMLPFDGLINAHGLSTHYTQYYYKYAKRPSATFCEDDVTCNPLADSNPALWCDTEDNLCRTKIREGGQCYKNETERFLPDNACWCPSEPSDPACNHDSYLCIC